MHTLTLNDGTVLQNSYAFETDGLYVYIKAGLSLLEVAELLSDPEKTAEIIYNDGSTDNSFLGYTRLTAVMLETNGRVSATLKK